MNTGKTEAEILEQMTSEAEAELASLREQVRVHEMYVAHLRSRPRPGLNGAPSPVGGALAETKEDAKESNREVGRSKFHPETPLYRRIEALMRKAGKPLRVPEIERGLVEAGVKTTAKKSMRANIASAIKRHPELFSRQAWGLWGLKEWEAKGKVAD